VQRSALVKLNDILSNDWKNKNLETINVGEAYSVLKNSKTRNDKISTPHIENISDEAKRLKG